MTLTLSKRKHLIAVLALSAFSLLVFLVIVGLGSFEYWRRGTPEYSLRQIGTVIETHDMQLFLKHVDLRSVGNRMMDDLVMDQRRQPGSNALSQGVLDVFRPRLLESFEAQVERYVETGHFSDSKTSDDFGLTNLKERFGKIGPISFTKINGRSAVVGLTVTPPNAPNSVILPLKMRQTSDDYWQLTEVDLSNIQRFPKTVRQD